MADADRNRSLDLLPPAAWAAVRTGALEGRTLFITGATGFVGRWLLAAVGRVNDHLARPLLVRALSRSTAPLAAPWLTWVSGDVRDYQDDAHADLLLHAALPSTATPKAGDAALRETARRGAEMVAAHAVRCGTRRSLVLSSGAVYGATTGPVAESAPLESLATDDTYAHAKRDVEMIARAGAGGGHDVVVARLFTCIGAGYRSHGHLAHVSLIADALAGRPLLLRSDGSAVRSYLFGADLAVWLLALLSCEGSDTVNVGSDVPVSLLEFARLVARISGRGPDAVTVGGASATVRPHFVPDIAHARSRYGLEPWTPLEQVIKQTLAPGARESTG